MSLRAPVNYAIALFMATCAAISHGCNDQAPQARYDDGHHATRSTAQPSAETTTDQSYETLAESSPDGIGKAYMGREIAQVMGHLGAGWLERPEREADETPRVLIDSLGLGEDDVVADIGAGSGYFTFRLAERVPSGRVLAVDIQPEILEFLRTGEAERDLENVEPILGRVDDPNLPANQVDLVLMVDAYHEFDHPREMMAGIMRSLKPGWRVALVEYRGEDPAVAIQPLHKMTQTQAKREMTAAGLEHVQTLDVLPTQHLMIFRKPMVAERQRQDR